MPVGNSVMRKFVAVALREPGQPLHLRLLDQAAAVRLVLGVRCKARATCTARRRRRARVANASAHANAVRAHERARRRSAIIAIRPDVGELGRAGVELARHPAGEERLAPGLDREPHRARHPHRVARLRDRGVHQHAGAAQLHRDRGVRRRADARVDEHRHLRCVEDELAGSTD